MFLKRSLAMKKFCKIFFIFMAVILMFNANVEAKLSDSVNNFGWKFLQTQDKNKNIFYSPYSLCAALSIVANGATDTTQKEILSVFDAESVESLNDGFKDFRAVMEKNYTGDRLLKESNLMLVNKKFSARGIDADFKNVLKKVYNSEVRTADFENNLDGEKKKISAWVAKSTDNFIPNYSAAPTADTVVDLLNVIYFKGGWDIPFEKRSTHDRNFTNSNGSKIEVPMMFQIFESSIAYCEDDKYKAIALPYKKNDYKNVAEMILILPKDANNLNIAEDWNAETFDYKKNFLQNLKGTFQGEVYVRLPKLDLDIKNDVVDNLKSLGISRAFTDGAEIFHVVNDTALKIDKVLHQAKLKVDEQGTEAAAVTEVVMLEAAAVPDQFRKPRVTFYAERPFLFVIRDVESEINLFVGVANSF